MQCGVTLWCAAVQNDILWTEAELKQRGTTVHKIDRGGQVTWHGPGQLVGYPIFNASELHAQLTGSPAGSKVCSRVLGTRVVSRVPAGCRSLTGGMMGRLDGYLRWEAGGGWGVGRKGWACGMRSAPEGRGMGIPLSVRCLIYVPFISHWPCKRV